MVTANRYRLVRLIGRGGMGSVYEAVALGAHGFRRRVAVKRVLAPFAADRRTVTMFLDEARIVSQLHHASIVSVVDYGELDGAPFQVLELVDGLDARELVARAAELGHEVPPEIALLLVRETAHALAYAHGATADDGRPMGIVHRDVSPQNILVSWEGDVKLTDFGVAFALDRDEHTQDGQVKGKVRYMAPEQIAGGKIDARTDVFALGCCLCALLTGESPVDRERLVEMLQGRELDLPESLPDDVRRIVAHATRVRPRDRYAGAAEMAAEVGDAIAARGVGDPRTRLRAWLEPLKRPRETSKEESEPLEILASAAPDGSRVFSAAGGEWKAGDAVRTRPERPVVRPRRRGRQLSLVLVASFFALAALSVGVALWSRGGTTETDVPETLPSPVAHTLPPLEPALPPEAPAPVVDAGASEPVAEPERVPGRTLRASGDAGARAAEGIAQQPPPPPPAPRVVVHVRIGTLPFPARGTVVVVDGRDALHGPGTIEVAPGVHGIELHDEQGTVLCRASLRVSADDADRAEPPRWSPPPSCAPPDAPAHH